HEGFDRAFRLLGPGQPVVSEPGDAQQRCQQYISAHDGDPSWFCPRPALGEKVARECWKGVYLLRRNRGFFGCCWIVSEAAAAAMLLGVRIAGKKKKNQRPTWRLADQKGRVTPAVLHHSEQGKSCQPGEIWTVHLHRAQDMVIAEAVDWVR